MRERRADGTLEADVLGALWTLDGPATPAEVKECLAGDLAYTTVMTVLSRLWQKGLAERVRQGRGYAYRAALTEGELATQRITATLEAASDRHSVLAAFVGSLSPRDVKQLRTLLRQSENERP